MNVINSTVSCQSAGSDISNDLEAGVGEVKDLQRGNKTVQKRLLCCITMAFVLLTFLEIVYLCFHKINETNFNKFLKVWVLQNESLNSNSIGAEYEQEEEE